MTICLFRSWYYIYHIDIDPRLHTIGHRTIRIYRIYILLHLFSGHAQFSFQSPAPAFDSVGQNIRGDAVRSLFRNTLIQLQ